MWLTGLIWAGVWSACFWYFIGGKLTAGIFIEPLIIPNVIEYETFSSGILPRKITMDVKEENYRKRMNLGQDGNSLVQLLVLNAVLFVVLKFVFVFFLLTNASTEG